MFILRNARLLWKNWKGQVVLIVLLTAVLPFMPDHNPAGASPLAVCSFLAAIGWFGIILWLFAPYGLWEGLEDE